MHSVSTGLVVIMSYEPEPSISELSMSYLEPQTAELS